MKETRTRCGTTLAAATLALLTACGGDGPTSPTPRPTVTVTLSGSVREIYANLLPIADVAVEAVDGPDAGTFVFTGRAGDYRMTNIRWGVFRLRASKSAYGSSEVTINVPPPGGPGVVVNYHFRLTRPGCPG